MEMKNMKAASKTKKQLLDELALLQQRIAALEIIEKEARQAQRDFGEKLGRYFPQVEHMNEAIYVIFDRKYEFVNSRFAELFGVTSEEVCSHDFDPMSLVAQESRRFIREKYREGSRGEFAVRQFEYTGLTREGLRIECETFVLFIPYKWGIAVHGMLRNVSVRKRIDVELQRQRGDLQIVLNSIPTSIFYTDKNHRFIRTNQAFCKSLGLPMEQIIGKTLTELFPNLPPEQLTHFNEVSEEIMRAGHSKRGIIEIFPSLRGRRWIQNDRVPYRDEEGKIIGVICLAIDISELRETEEKLWYLSFHDVLTGLYNRAYFDEEMIRLENGRQFPVSIVAIRLDDLKSTNENHGIAAGNELLRRTAKVMKAFRTEDVVARISGDKFAALLPLADNSIGETALGRVQEALKSHNKQYGGVPLQLSFGVATGNKGCKLIDILKQADKAIR
jgi:diguanylate cyclase (GGDEF)-like protein/PAS domain S-box-containing protein